MIAMESKIINALMEKYESNSKFDIYLYKMKNSRDTLWNLHFKWN